MDKFYLYTHEISNNFLDCLLKNLNMYLSHDDIDASYVLTTSTLIIENTLLIYGINIECFSLESRWLNNNCFDSAHKIRI